MGKICNGGVASWDTYAQIYVMLVMGTYFYPKTDVCVSASSILQHYKGLNAMLENNLGDFL